MSGGACFTPRLKVRPEYPSATYVIKKTLLSYARVSCLCMLAALSLEPFYQRITKALFSSGHSERLVFTLFTLAVHTGTYVLCNGFFYIAEHFGWLIEYKFQRKPYQIPSTALIRRTLLEAAVNQLVTGPPVVWFFFLAFKYFGMPSMSTQLPHWLTVLGSFALANFINDIGFYFSHRLVHSKFLYAKIHKQHHTYNGSIGITAEYASPIEQILSNQLPSIGGCLFFGAHPLVFFVWIIARLQQTYEGHSGFCFYGTFLHSIGLTYADGAAYHDFHHSGNRGNFGALWLDWICGTMDAWVALGGTEGYIKLCAENAKQK